MLRAGPTACSRCTRCRSGRTWPGSAVGFVAGDPELVRYLGEIRKHAGLMMPAPIQAAAAAALGDDDARRRAAGRATSARRALMLDGLAAHGLVHDGGPAPFYLWLRAEEQADDGWEIAARLAEAGHARRARAASTARPAPTTSGSR